jgi:hypothetical protein
VSTIARALLWAFVILMGLDLGAGVYEMWVNVAGWSSAITTQTPDGEAYMRFAPNAGNRWWIVLTPLLALVTLAGLIAAFRSAGPASVWMRRATGLELVIVLSTFAWFVPNIMRLLAHYHELPADFVAARTSLWVSLNGIRAVLTFVAWIMGLRALTFLGSSANLVSGR